MSPLDAKRSREAFPRPRRVAYDGEERAADARPMIKPTASQVDAARRLLARETDEGDGAEARADAARRAYEKIVGHLGTLVGEAAARALFARSVKLTAPEFPALAKIPLALECAEALGDQLTACLRGQTPDAVTETVVALCATLLALLGTLIGERLTAKVLRDSWAAFPVSSPSKETTR